MLNSFALDLAGDERDGVKSPIKYYWVPDNNDSEEPDIILSSLHETPEEKADRGTVLEPSEQNGSNLNSYQYNEAIPEVIAIPKSLPSVLRVEVLQRWEGVVIWINKDSFGSRLKDLTDPQREEELVEFSIDEISENDDNLLQVGAVFYWSISYRIEPSGQKRRESTIRFRRLPVWNSSEIEKAKQAASKYDEILG